MVDPEPDGRRLPWRTYRACLERAPKRGHLAVIQDDVWLADDFEELVAAAVAACPCRVLCLFVSGQAKYTSSRVLHAADGFVQLDHRDHFIPVVANVYPVEYARAILELADRRKWGPRAQRADDAIVKDACVALGIEPWATVPSLVEHLDDVPSIMGGVGGRRRRAVRVHPSLAGLVAPVARRRGTPLPA